MIAMEKKNMPYFNRPTQVVFADPDNAGEWIVGIAYKDEIICACCGGIFDISDVVDMATEAGIKNPIYDYNEWADISDEIVGDALPNGLSYCIDGIVEDAEYEQHAFLLEEEEEV